MWNGAFSPNVRKHRDYLHSTVWAHLRAQGATWSERQRVPVVRDPISESDIDRVIYALVIITLPDSSEYEYLIPLNSDGGVEEEDIEAAFQEYVKNPVEGGRIIEDYIDAEFILEGNRI